ncbi:uncharacterized protein BCR38DRAFT_88206 [Pseudomassariella vexata]|uniref:BZIP domain-containing protein n=1 Tax=Pseudomassariella vexata TaxID=1141098 RepID=A0A1Y2EDB7_9PEZI|nr:uncharacterized protein BCR38DRAFT_88206 [Pseudomassariella vexata]ORY69568.1 hypothetical protein BCR38DRAFT_88206 [Pseudomassariella vexata]
MSQKGSASRPASPRPTTTSSTTVPRTSPSSAQPGLRGTGDGLSSDSSRESCGVPRTHAETSQPAGQRTLDVHNMLNPAETCSTPTTAAPTAPRPPEDNSARPNPAAGQYESSPSTSQPYVFRGQAMPVQPLASPRPTGRPSAPSPAPSERASPHAQHPYQALGAPRQYLNPRSPRAGSMGHHGAHFRTLSAQPSQFSPAAGPGHIRPFPGDSPLERSPTSGEPPAIHFGGIGSPGVLPPVPMSNLAAPPRSSSQPIIGRVGPASQETGQSQRALGHQSRPSRYPAVSSYTAGIPQVHRGFPPPLPQGDLRWSGGVGGNVSQPQTPNRWSSFPVSDGQSTNLLFRTEQGDEMIVPFDTRQGSRQADEKRQRNAGASARFRQRKKEREISRDNEMHKLETENRQLEKRVHDVEIERDHYRADRDRLRDLVYRTPSISEFAYQGLPSPTTSRPGGSFPDRSPLAPVAPVAPPTPLPPVTYGQVDPTTGERPARRRRTDPQVEFTTPTYASGIGTLGPMAPAYAASSSQPGTPSAGPTARLPPFEWINLPLDQNLARRVLHHKVSLRINANLTSRDGLQDRPDLLIMAQAQVKTYGAPSHHRT